MSIDLFNRFFLWPSNECLIFCIYLFGRLFSIHFYKTGKIEFLIEFIG